MMLKNKQASTIYTVNKLKENYLVILISFVFVWGFSFCLVWWLAIISRTILGVIWNYMKDCITISDHKVNKMFCSSKFCYLVTQLVTICVLHCDSFFHGWLIYLNFQERILIILQYWYMYITYKWKCANPFPTSMFYPIKWKMLTCLSCTWKMLPLYITMKTIRLSYTQCSLEGEK